MIIILIIIIIINNYSQPASNSVSLVRVSVPPAQFKSTS